MDVLKQLYEQHFHSPADRVTPLQGQARRIGPRYFPRRRRRWYAPSGSSIPVREENVAFLEFSRHFRRHGLPVPAIYAEDLANNAYLEEDFGDTTLFEFLTAHRDGDDDRSTGNRSVSKGRFDPAAISGRGWPRFELQGVLSALQLRSPVHRLGSELLQVLLPSARRNFFQRAGARKRLRRLDQASCSPRRTTISSIATFNRAT